MDESKEIQRMLPVKLLNSELLQRGKVLADVLSRISKLEAEKKVVVEDFKERIGLLEAEASRTAIIIRDGEESRLVPCRMEYYFAENKKQLRRLDTDEIIEVQAMTDQERQLHLNNVANQTQASAPVEDHHVPGQV